MTYLEEIYKYKIGENETLPWYFRAVNSSEFPTRTIPYQKYDESQDNLFEYFPSTYKTPDLQANISDSVNKTLNGENEDPPRQ